MRRLALAIAVAAGLSGAAASPADRVDLSLVLAVDSSSSVDAEEFALQMEGLAHAFREPALLAAIESGVHRAIAVTVVEWSNAAWQRENIGWTVIHDGASARAFADQVENAPRLIYGGATSISGALRFAMRQLGRTAALPERSIIELSGDRSHTQRATVAEGRHAALAA